MNSKSPILWLFRRIRKRIPALLLMTATNVGQALFGVYFALGTRQVIDSATSGQRDAFLRACALQGSIILGILICLAISRHLRDRLAADLDRDWKIDLLHNLLHSDYASVAGYHSGELINRLNNDVRIANDGILSSLPDVAYLLTKLIAAFLVLVKMEPMFSLLVVGAGILVVIVTGIMRRSLKGLNKRVSEEDGKVSGFLQETLEKLLMVQAMDVSDEMEQRSQVLLSRRYEMQRRRKNVSLFANTCISVMSYGAGFAALVWCSTGLLRGTLTFGTLTAITQLVSQLQSPFVSLSGIIPQYAAMTAAAERLMELYALPQEDSASEQLSRQDFAEVSAIGASGLCFSYDRDVILQDASFTLPKGAFAVITGPSGIGKSTLLKLLLGIFHPNSGELYLQLGDEKISADRNTRKAFAYVPQGNLLLSGTVRDNLVIARPDATEEEIRQAVHISAMDEFLPQLPAGLDTLLGESGAGLSEGQAQRLAIARGIISGAPILLLDESTSALDAHTEQLVLERIRSLSDRTCIIVTHRPAAIALCDWNLQINHGKITMERTETSRQTADQ